MLFPDNIVLFGASAVVALAIYVSARIYIAALPLIGNPALSPKARTFLGWITVLVIAAVLVIGAAITLLLKDTNSPPQKPAPQKNDQGVGAPGPGQPPSPGQHDGASLQPQRAGAGEQ